MNNCKFLTRVKLIMVEMLLTLNGSLGCNDCNLHTQGVSMATTMLFFLHCRLQHQLSTKTL